jgi:glycosyltransferase involved in cell wall biosynthesis
MAAPIPLAFVLSSFETGGTERQMLELIERLDRSRWDVHVVSMRTRGRWLARAAAAAHLTTFPVTSFRRADVLRQLWSFAGWCRQNRIAVVHTGDQPANIFGLTGASLAGVPLRVGNRRYVHLGRTRLELGVQRLAYAGAHKIVANCGAAADRLFVERVPRHKVAIIANGIDPSRFPPRRPRSLLRNVITVANLRPGKGHDVLIEAAAKVLHRFPDARFEIVGSGPLREPLARLAEARGVAHRLVFAGHQDDVAARLAGADLLVHPSLSEAFPNAVLEAMAAGLPIVASNVGGIPEIIETGRNGLLVPAAAPAPLADRICELFGNPEKAADLGTAARNDVCGKYSFDRMVARFQDLYADELGRRGITSVPAPLAAA